MSREAQRSQRYVRKPPELQNSRQNRDPGVAHFKPDGVHPTKPTSNSPSMPTIAVPDGDPIADSALRANTSTESSERAFGRARAHGSAAREIRSSSVTALLIVLLGAVATAVGLRVAASRRRRILPALVAHDQADWASMCRVSKGGHFLDQGRLRRGMGPRAVLVSRHGTLEWRPDSYEEHHGDQPFLWQAEDVRCRAERQRRDITGIRYTELVLDVPQGELTLGLFNEVGDRPSFLSAT